jgi:cytochrome c6
MLNFCLSTLRLYLLFTWAFMSNFSQAADVKGSQLYVIYCADCHGVSGDSVLHDAPRFSKSEALIKSDIDLFDAISKGNKAMPLYKGILNDQEIFDVITYIRTLN